jgi:hypothetical protein
MTVAREDAARVKALVRAVYPNGDIRVERTFGGLRIEVCFLRDGGFFRADIGGLDSAVVAELERRAQT